MESKKETRCGVCETPIFERNNYFHGKVFTIRDLLQEQSYFNKKRWLINRMVLGWGVVCGLDVEWDSIKRTLKIAEGMALDCCGREIVVCDNQEVSDEKIAEARREASKQTGYDQSPGKDKFLLCLEYDKCKTEPVELLPVGCDKQERVEYNRVRDSFKLRIKPWTKECVEQPYGQVRCFDQIKRELSGDDPPIAPCKTETIHHRLCRELKKPCPECTTCDCVVLATIYVSGDTQVQQSPPGQSAPKPGFKVRVDPCTDRRFVYNNSLLYDLIYCHHGDLPHIVDFSWRKYTYPDREIEWNTFVDIVKQGFKVYFDQEMDKDSLNSHTFLVSYLHKDTGTTTLFEKFIPVKDPIEIYREGDCFTATFRPKPNWIEKEVEEEEPELSRRDGVDINIRLVGSRIWSKGHKKALDGEFLADRLPTGNGTQGGDFIDWFRVLPRNYKKQQYQQSQQSVIESLEF